MVGGRHDLGLAFWFCHREAEKSAISPCYSAGDQTTESTGEMNLGFDILISLTTVGACAFLVATFPALKNPGAFLTLGLIATAVTYGRNLPTFAVWILLPYAIVLLLHRFTEARADKRKIRWKCCSLAIGLITIVFLGNAYYPFSKGLTAMAFAVRWTLLAPDMWLFLRIVCFLWEYGSGKIQAPSPLGYACWSTLPFTLRGPLLRYSLFHRQMAYPSPQTEEAETFPWILSALSIFQLALGFLVSRSGAVLQGAHRHWSSALIAVGVAPWGFYLNSAGLSNLMRCIAMPWGLTLPRNFNRPFGRCNLSAFWSAWNITATDFFRDSLFYQRWGLKKPSVYLNVFLTFVAVGLWHGVNPYWVLWGTLHGVGFCCYLFYRIHKEKLNQVSGESAGSQWRTLASGALTYLFVCACWYIPNKVIFLASGPWHCHN